MTVRSAIFGRDLTSRRICDSRGVHRDVLINKETVLYWNIVLKQRQQSVVFETLFTILKVTKQPSIDPIWFDPDA